MNNTKVIELPASTSFTPAQAIASAASMDLSDVLVIGYEGDRLVIRSSRMTCAEALFLLEKAKAWALTGGNP